MPNPSIKDEKMYQKLRDEGSSKEKAARIANASAKEGRSKVGARGGRAASYEEWTVSDLRKRASELDIAGRSSMTKDQLVNALRNH
jgi:hypothetical protein